MTSGVFGDAKVATCCVTCVKIPLALILYKSSVILLHSQLSNLQDSVDSEVNASLVKLTRTTTVILTKLSDAGRLRFKATCTSSLSHSGNGLERPDDL